MGIECGIVSTDVEGIKEVIRDGQDGLTGKVEAWQELSVLCKDLIEDPRSLAEL